MAMGGGVWVATRGWVELCVMTCRKGGQEFNRVVLLSYDQKIDWSRAGLPHPILVAEVHALLNVPFEIWTLEKLATQIAAVT